MAKANRQRSKGKTQDRRLQSEYVSWCDPVSTLLDRVIPCLHRQGIARQAKDMVDLFDDD